MNKNSALITGKTLVIAAIFGLAIVVSVLTIFAINSEALVEDKPMVGAPSSQPNFSNQTANLSKNAIILPGIEKKQGGFDFDDEMKLKLKNISDAYTEQAKYPSYSIPIAPNELATKYLPDMPVASELPADLSDPNSPSLSILPSKFRYFKGEDLSATAQISGLSTDETSYVSAQLIMYGETLGVATVSTVKDQLHSYQLDFDSFVIDDIDWKENITIEVEFQLLGNIYTRHVTVEYLNTIAQVNDIATAEVQEEFLVIPVYVTTDKPGFHRLEANLYDAETDKPLIHLTAEDQILSNSGQLTFKAHIAALKASGSQGPYTIKDLLLRRLPSAPDYITEFGRVEGASYDVNGYDFSEFEDKPYINEKAQRIANELRNLGS